MVDSGSVYVSNRVINAQSRQGKSPCLHGKDEGSCYACCDPKISCRRVLGGLPLTTSLDRCRKFTGTCKCLVCKNDGTMCRQCIAQLHRSKQPAPISALLAEILW